MSKSIIVIGAGITGVSSAEWLRRDGWDVTIIDRIDPGHPDQTSFGNAGLIARGAIIPVSTPRLFFKAPAMLLNPNSPLYLRWSYLPRLAPWLVPFLRNGNERKVTEIAAALAALTNDSVDQHQALASGTSAAAFIHTGEYVNLYPQKSEYLARNMGSILIISIVLKSLPETPISARPTHLAPFIEIMDGYLRRAIMLPHCLGIINRKAVRSSVAK